MIVKILASLSVVALLLTPVIQILYFAAVNGNDAKKIWKYVYKKLNIYPRVFVLIISKILKFTLCLPSDAFQDEYHVLQSVIFSRVLLSNANPFSKHVPLFVIDLSTEDGDKQGKCMALLRANKSDIKSSVGNPFKSVHAACIALLGETSCGLGLFTVLGKKDRALVKQLNCDFRIKARGYVYAETLVKKPVQSGDLVVKSEIFNFDQNHQRVVLAQVETLWDIKLAQD